MSKNLNIDNINKFFYREKLDKEYFDEFNKLDVINVDIDDNISFFKTKKFTTSETKLPIKNEPNCLHINVTLKGIIHFKSDLNDYTNSAKKNETSINLMNKEEGVIHIPKNTELNNIVIAVKNEFLNKYFLDRLKNQDTIKKDFQNSKTKYLSKKQTDVKTAILANEIYNSPFIGDLEDVYIQSKIYELIYHEFKSFLDKDKSIENSSIKFSDDDIQRLHYAKKLIQEDKKYLSLKELSRTVALNEFKLKYGFKKLFNISVGAMVLNEKMEQSKLMLQSGELNINEISQILGYKYPSNFTLAFKKYFGISPSEVMKTRKYYY